MTDDALDEALSRTDVWEEQAEENVEKWGLQDIGMLLLAIAEENGEIAADAESILTADTPALETLLDITQSSGLAVRDGIERVAEADDGSPIEDRPTFSVDDDADLDAVQEEIDDLGALVIQLQAAVEEARIGESKD